jgi:hypothetical protein
MKTTTSYQISILLLIAHAVLGHGQIDQRSIPLKVSMCDLYEHPDQYAGKTIEVRASVSSTDLSLEDFSNQKPCSQYMRIDLEFPDKNTGPNVDLVRDEAFNSFFDKLHQGLNVIATFQGRFDPAFVWREHKRIRVGHGTEKGYGKKHRYDGRIVLQRLSDVMGRPVPRK